MNRLAGTRAYLCGAMDRAPDAGIEWRRRMRRTLSDLDIHWLDPTRKPIQVGTEDDESRRRRREAKASGDFDAIVREMNPIRRVDLRMVDLSDWIAVNLDMDIHACGTYEEICWANQQMKPILVHVEQGKREVPDWLFGMLPNDHIFDTWNEMMGYIRHVARDDCVLTYDRWCFFDWTGDSR